MQSRFLNPNVLVDAMSFILTSRCSFLNISDNMMVDKENMRNIKLHTGMVSEAG